MADEERTTDETWPARRAPWLPQLLLGVGFVFLLVVGVVTVLVPELADEPEEQEEVSDESAADESAADEPSADDAPADDAP